MLILWLLKALNTKPEFVLLKFTIKDNSIGVLYTNIDQALVNSLHRLLNCERGRLDCHVITTEYRKRVHCIHL